MKTEKSQVVQLLKNITELFPNCTEIVLKIASGNVWIETDPEIANNIVPKIVLEICPLNCYWNFPPKQQVKATRFSAQPKLFIPAIELSFNGWRLSYLPNTPWL